MPSFLLSSERDGAPAEFKYRVSACIGYGLDHLNLTMQAESLDQRNDFGGGFPYNRHMAQPRHDWYLKDWLQATNKKQSDIVRDLDWNKAKVSLMVRGLQPYTREEVNELAEYLNIHPHELLQHPDRAFATRRLHAEMIRLAHENDVPEEPQKKVSLN
jgi:hypothetical protein